MSKHARVRKPNAAAKSSPDLQSRSGTRTWWETWWPLFLIATLVAWAFLPALNNGFVTYDDPDYVTKNTRIQEGLSLSSIIWAFDPATRVSANWHPLTLLSHMLDCELFGLKPFGHHLTSLILHVANSVLLFVLLRGMTGTLWCSLAVAAWFGVHPAHVESVAWVAERKDVLSGLFFMLTLLAYHKYVKCKAEASSQTRTFYFLALAAFTLGLLAKPMLVTLPFVLLLLDYWPLQRVSLVSLRSLLREKAPFFALTIVSCVITYSVQKQGGAMAAIEPIPFTDRVSNAVVSYLRYVGTLVWPTDLLVFHPFQKSWPLSLVVLAILFVVGVSLAPVWWGRQSGYWPVGWFWFLGTLVPVIGLVQVGAQSIADRYTYLPSIGLFIVLVWGADEIRRQWRVPGLAVGAMGAAAAVACIVATRHQVEVWQDGETLFRRVLAKYADHYYPHFALGVTLVEKRRFQEGIMALQRARELNPKFVLSYLNLAAALLAEGKAKEAVAVCHQATVLEPKMLSAWSNLGRYQMNADDVAGAVESFQRANAISPNDAKVHSLLGGALRSSRRFDEAIIAQRRALELQPGLAPAREELIKALIQNGAVDEARIEWRRFSGLTPNSVVEHNSFGVLLAEIGQLDAATKEFEAAHKMAPDDVDAKNNLVRAYAMKANAGKGEPPPARQRLLP